jgi:hypothetical protein
MNVRRILRAALVALLVCAGLVLQWSCARSGDGGDDEPVLFLPDSGAKIADLCVETQCPWPFATCSGKPGACTVDLRNDVANCGACHAACPKATPQTHGRWLCSEGKCHLACEPLWANCNLLPEDGCEVSTDDDPLNCGFCGNKCDPGVLCWKGACGCPNGFTQCGNDCVNVKADDLHCGACDTPCKAPPIEDPRWICGPGISPPNTKFRCGDAACALRCDSGFQDCNSDFCGDGCEIDILNDPMNCGACGNACDPGQFCANGVCLCPPGTTRCGQACVDIANDVRNCGGCGRRCPGPTSGGPFAATTEPVNGGPACNGGVCSYVCFPGWENCDGKVANGCEVNVNTDQHNCGACGTKCDIRGGQPCVLGKCLTKACPNGPVR